jgi:hypothetical protein
MIREISSKPIPVRSVNPAAPDPDWRLLADPETGAWRVEQRQPGGWAMVAAFQIEVGRCIPEEEALPEPPPEAMPQPVKPEERPAAPGGVFRIPRPGSQPKPPARPTR